MENKQAFTAYDYLTTMEVFWDRKDDNHIYVATEGYKTNECYVIENGLMRHGFRAVDQQFDKISGKTFTTYKHK